MQGYYNYWGKADKKDNYHLLVYHSLDVAAVGKVLLENHSNLLDRFSHLTGIETSLFRKLILFFLSLHDLGKFADAFQGLIPSIYSKLNPNNIPKNYNIRHDSLGFMLWKKNFLKNSFGTLSGKLIEKNLFPLHSSSQNRKIENILQLFISITTGHHGTPPSNDRSDLYSHFTEKNIEDAFQFLTTAYPFFFQKEEALEMENLNFEIVTPRLTQFSFWLAGFSVLCDWIGSNKEFFRFKTDPSISLEDYWSDFAILNATRSVQYAGILPKKLSNYKTPFELFSKEKTPFSPTPLQTACDLLPLQNEPQLILLEDVTGAGKTEASLILAKRLMEVCKHNGLWIGLPTMATANGMYNRVSSFYSKLYHSNERPSLILAHGAKNLSKNFTSSIISDQIPEDISYSKEEESASANCTAWLADSNKKATLADVAVGTIDQVLISILLSKFQSLRLYGMMDKVLILDEVHAYDSYMNSLIESLLKAQASIGGNVILLTATLPNKLKKQFISSFQLNESEEDSEESLSDAYPLLTQVKIGKPLVQIPMETREEVRRTVKIKFFHQEEEIYSFIENAIREKKCICWIRNTVKDAIDSYQTLSANPSFKEENIILFHARFAMGDRLDKEQEVLHHFGKDSSAQNRESKIVIATQVVEQSLDLDFDIMITDLAPIDLIIQRAGRLQRHTRDAQGNRSKNKEEREKPILYIFSPELETEPDENWYSSFSKGSAKVYPDHGKLYLSAKILKQKGEFKMPEDARNLIEFVYGSKELIPKSLVEISKKNETLNRQKSATSKNNTIQLEQGYTFENNTNWNDNNAPTRLGLETIKIILAKYEDGTLSPWYSDDTFPWSKSEVNVMSYMIQSYRKEKDPKIEKQIEICKESLPDKGKYSLLLPLYKENGDWIGIALDSQGKESKYIYNAKFGFRKVGQGKVT